MQRKSNEEREELIKKYRACGLSVRVFCSREGLAEQTLRNWIGYSKETDKKYQGFVEVSSGYRKMSKATSDQSTVKYAPAKYGVVIRFAQGVSIEVFPESDQETVKWIFSLIQSRI